MHNMDYYRCNVGFLRESEVMVIRLGDEMSFGGAGESS